MDESLKNAIWNFLYDDYAAVKALLTGGFYLEMNTREEKEVVYPYGVFSIISNTGERDSGNKWTNGILQISIFDDDNKTTTANSIMALIHTKFEDSESSFTVDGKTAIDISRTSGPMIDYLDLGDSEAWHVHADYIMKLQLT